MNIKSIDNKNITWINTGRGLCLLCVYVAHCNFYYLSIDSPIYFVYKPIYLSFLFFISGFLLFKDLDNFPFKRKISSITNKLLWPIIIFPSIIWIPKMLAHGNEVSLKAFLIDIFGGTAVWFISSLIIAQILSLFLIYFFKKKIHLMLFISIFTMLSGFYLATIHPTPFPWYYKSGLVALFFLVLGGLFRQYYDKFKCIISHKSLIISGILYFGVMLINYYTIRYQQAIMSVTYDNIPLGLFNNLLGIFFMIQLCHFLPEIKWLQYIGKNSIVFYFFAGGVPLVIGYLTRTFIPLQGYLMTFIVTVTCLAIIFPINYIIKRYFAWTLDFSIIINHFKSQNKN